MRLTGRGTPGVAAVAASVALAAAVGSSGPRIARTVRVAPAALPRIAAVDERYESYNVEMAEVIGGSFWKPYDSASIAALAARAAAPSSNGAIHVGHDTTMFQSRPPIDLANARLRRLAAALGPAYVRVSGTWANTVWFQDSTAPAPRKAPKGFDGVLTRREWRGVIDFARAANARIVTSFAVGAGVRDSAGVWTPVQAAPFLAYTKAAGGRVVAAELFNEPTMPSYGGAPGGYDGAAYARDFAVFRAFVKAAAPDMLIVGPGSVGEGLPTSMLPAAAAIGAVLPTPAILSATPRPIFDVFSYHYYGAPSIRCASMGAALQTTPEAALSDAWLARTDTVNMYYESLRDRFEPAKPVWVTETADAACGGNPWASTFLDTFRYVDQLGRLARRGVQAVFHNTLASSEYGLLDQRDFSPRPSYWAALLWRRLMGVTVLDAGPPPRGLHLYAHCLRGRPGGVTLLAINTSRTQPESLSVPAAAERYTLTAPRLEGTTVELDGRTLALGVGDALPALQGAPVPAGGLALPPTSITFLAIADAGNRRCR